MGSQGEKRYAASVDCEIFALTDAETEENAGNPCLGQGVPLIPRSREEVFAFAGLMGWKVEEDEQGILLRPGF